MTLTKDQIKAAALQLGVSEREELVEELLISLWAENQDLDQEWLAEAGRRDARFRAGITGAKQVNEVIDRIAQKARP